jgi:WD40 repeat protein/HEAT repeat protein/uncharacterized protein YjbI with pentapeptide repeats
MKNEQSEDTVQQPQSQFKNHAQLLIAEQNTKINILDDQFQQLITSPAHALKMLAIELFLEGDMERWAQYAHSALSIDEGIFDDLKKEVTIIPVEMLGYKNIKIFLDKCDESNSYINQDMKKNHLFMRLIQQYFIEAYHLFQKLISDNALQKDEAIRFVLLNKYRYRYEVVIAFLIRLIYQNSVEKSAKELLWDALFVFDVDCIGIRHTQLMIQTLEESGRPDEPLVEQVADWVLASLKSRHPETSRQLRLRLVELFSVCPTVTQHTFDRLIRRSRIASPKGLWEGLTVRPRKNLLLDYWLPLLGHLPDEYTSFLITLITECHHDEEVRAILKSVEWIALKKIPLRRKQLFDQVSQYIEETYSKPNSEAAMKNLLPVWLSLLEEGDNPVRLVELLQERKEPWIQWATRLVKAVLDPTQRTDIIVCFLSLLENQHPERESVMLFLPVMCDWDRPPNEVFKLWWCLLKEQDPIIFQRAVQRLGQLLAYNNSHYQELQEIIWQRRQWSFTGKAPVHYRKERFAILLEALQNQDIYFVENAQRTIELCDNNQWNIEEARQLITILMKQTSDDHGKRDAVRTLGSLVHHHSNELFPVLLRMGSYVPVHLLRTLIDKYAIAIIPLILDGLKNFESNIRDTYAWLLQYADQQHIQKVITALLEALKDPEYLVRVAAAEVLGQVGEDHANEVIPELITRVNDTSKMVRCSVVTALGKFAHHHASEVIPTLLQGVQDLDTSVQACATEALGRVDQYHASKVTPLLMSAIEDQNSPIRMGAVRALGQLAQHNPNEMIPVLLRMITVDDWYGFTREIIKALGTIIHYHSREVVPALLKVIHHKDTHSSVLEEAITALGQASEDHAEQLIPVLLETMKSKDYVIVAAAAEAVGKVGRYRPTQVIPTLLVMMKDPDLYSRIFIVRVLGEVAQYHTSEVIFVLLEAMEDLNSLVRGNAASAVGHFGSYYAGKAILALVKMISNEGEVLALRPVFRALEKLTEFHTNETLTSFLNTIKEKSDTFMTRWKRVDIENFDRLPAHILSDLRAVLIKMTHCPRSYIFPLVDGSRKSKNQSYAMLMLPLICNYHLQLPLTIPSDSNSLITLSDLVIAVTQLADPKQRTNTAAQLRDYYARHKGKFINQLADLLQQQLTCVPEIVLLCQMLNITSITWLSELLPWYKNKPSPHEWRFPLACLAQLLCDEGSSLFLVDENRLIICQHTGPTFTHAQFEPRFVTRLLEEIQYYLRSLGVPCRGVDRLLLKQPTADIRRVFSGSQQTFVNDNAVENETEMLPHDIVYIDGQNRRVLSEVVGKNDVQDICKLLLDQSSEDPIEWVLNRPNQEKAGPQLSEPRQQALLSQLSKASGELSKILGKVGRLELHDFLALNEATLLSVMPRFTRLGVLGLYKCFNVASNPFNNILTTCLYLHEITLSDINIEMIGSEHGSILEAKQLTKLILIRCHRLAIISFSAAILRELIISDCKNLKTIKMIGSLSLLNSLMIDKCPLLTRVDMNPLSLKVLRFANLMNMHSINEEFRKYLVSFLKKFGSDQSMAKSNGAVFSILHWVGQSFENTDDKHPDFSRDDLKNLVVDTADLIALKIAGFDLSGARISNVTLEQSNLSRLSFDNAVYSESSFGPKLIWLNHKIGPSDIELVVKGLVFLRDDNHLALMQANGHGLVLNCEHKQAIMEFSQWALRDRLDNLLTRSFLGGVVPPYITIYYPGTPNLWILEFDVSASMPAIPTLEQLKNCHGKSDIDKNLQLLFYRADLFLQLILTSSTGKAVNHLDGNPNRFFSVAGKDFSELSERLGSRKVANLWTGRELISSTTMSHDGESVAIGNGNGNIYLWKFRAILLVEKKLLKSKAGSVTALSYAPNDLRIVSGHTDNSIHLWDCKTAECLWVYEGHTHAISALAFSHGGGKFASAALDGTVRIWDTRDDYPYLYRGKRNGPLSINKITTADIVGLDDSNLKLMSLAGHKFNLNAIKVTNSRNSIHATLIDTITLTHDVNTTSCLRFSHDSKLLAAGRSDGVIIVWDNPSKNRPKFELLGHRSRIKTMIFSLSDQILISGGLDATIRIWSMDNGEILSTLRGHTNSVNSLSLSDKSNVLVSGSNDGTVKIWQLNPGKCIQTIINSNDVVAHGPSILLSANSNSMLKFGRLNSPRGYSDPNSAVMHVAIDADGYRLASSDTVSTTRIFAVSTGRILSRRPQSHTADKHSMIVSLSFSPDGKYLLSCSSHGTTLAISTIDGVIVRRIFNKEILTTDTFVTWDPAMIVSYNRYNSDQVNIVRFIGGFTYQYTINLQSYIKALAVDLLGNVIAVAYANGNICLHVISDLHRKFQGNISVFSLLDCIDTKLPLSYSCNNLPATCAFSRPNGRILAYGLCNGEVVIMINDKQFQPQCLYVGVGHLGAILSIRFFDCEVFTGGADATIRSWSFHRRSSYSVSEKYAVNYCSAPVTCFYTYGDSYVSPGQGCKLEIGNRREPNLNRLYDIPSPAIDIRGMDNELIVVAILECKILLMNWRGDLLKITSFNNSLFWRSELTDVPTIEREKWLRKTDESNFSPDKFRFFKIPKNPGEAIFDFAQNESIINAESATEAGDVSIDLSIN